MRKKMLYITLTGLVVFTGVVFYNANNLKNIHIKKSILVKGSQQEAFDMICFMGNFPSWSPFLAQDPTQKYHITGADGQLGARFHWIGNNGKDEGYQEVVGIDSLRTVSISCNIQKPFVASPQFEYTLEETKEGIEIVQIFKLQSGWMPACIMWIVGAKKSMEETNQQGLELLKKAIEK